jgi:hypothetical protein
MDNERNILLIYILLSYLIPILVITYDYNNKSLSSVINDPVNKSYILTYMCIMGMFSLLYEYEFNDNVSLLILLVLIIGIIGVILTTCSLSEDDPLHTSSVVIACVSILVYMIYHNSDNNPYKNILIFLQVIIGLSFIINYVLRKQVSFCESLFVINFAIYYLLLHYMNS